MAGALAGQQMSYRHVKDLKSLARRASGHGAWGEELQRLTGCGDETAESELEKRLREDRQDYAPGKSSRKPWK